MKCAVKCIAVTLLVIGGLNWGLVGFFDLNLVSKLLGAWPVAEKIVYDLVGVAALVYAMDHFFCPCNKDGKDGKSCGGMCKCDSKKM